MADGSTQEVVVYDSYGEPQSCSKAGPTLFGATAPRSLRNTAVAGSGRLERRVRSGLHIKSLLVDFSENAPPRLLSGGLVSAAPSDLKVDEGSVASKLPYSLRSKHQDRNPTIAIPTWGLVHAATTLPYRNRGSRYSLYFSCWCDWNTASQHCPKPPQNDSWGPHLANSTFSHSHHHPRTPGYNVVN